MRSGKIAAYHGNAGSSLKSCGAVEAASSSFARRRAFVKADLQPRATRRTSAGIGAQLGDVPLGIDDDGAEQEVVQQPAPLVERPD